MWYIVEDGYFVKKLRRLRSNTEVIDKYKRALFELSHSADPEKLGGRKRGRLRHLFV